MAHYIIIA